MNKRAGVSGTLRVVVTEAVGFSLIGQELLRQMFEAATLAIAAANSRCAGLSGPSSSASASLAFWHGLWSCSQASGALLGDFACVLSNSLHLGR